MSSVYVQQVESLFGAIVRRTDKIIETSEVTFIAEAGETRSIGLLPSARLVTTMDLARRTIPVQSGSGIVSEMKKASNDVMTYQGVDCGLVHVNSKFRQRRGLFSRTFAPSKTIRFIDGNETPALNRPNTSIAKRIRIARRFLGL